MSLIAYPNALKYREQATDPWSTATIFAKADLESLADKFDTTETYTEGEIVLYQGGMYKCKAGGAGPGAWDATEWDQTTVEAELAALQTEVDSVKNTLTQLEAETETVENGLAIIIEGNSCASGASQGQYVYLKDSTITGYADGLYTAAQAIPANTTIDGTYLTAVSGGGLNSLKDSFQSHVTTRTESSTYSADETIYITAEKNGYIGGRTTNSGANYFCQVAVLDDSNNLLISAMSQGNSNNSAQCMVYVHKGQHVRVACNAAFTIRTGYVD